MKSLNTQLPAPTKQQLPRLTILSLLLAGAGLTSVPAAAQQETTLDTVVVTASGFEQKIIDAPASISVITREELEKGSYRDLTDALRSAPGVIMTRSDNNTQDITLRGMGASYTLILVDGKRMSTRETQSNGSTGTDQSWVPPLEAIERIEVVRGPMSSLYGSDAMGGVVNIITRKVAKQWGGSVRVDTVQQTHSESGNEYRSSFYLAGPIKEDLLGLSITGVYSQREEDKILSGYNEHENIGLTAKLALTPTRNHDFTLEYGTSEQNYQSTPGKTLEITETLSDRDFEREHVALSHRGRWDFGTSDSHIQYEETENKSREMTIQNTTANTSWSIPIAQSHLLTVGASFKHEDLLDKTTNKISSRTTVDRQQYAVFAENEWSINNDFSLTTGLRYDDDETAGSQLSPRIYGVWHVAPQWTVKGGVSTGFRAPALRETLTDWGATSKGGDRYGNPDLKAEKSLTKEIGFIYSGDNKLNASLTLFDNEFEDKISRVPCPSCGPANKWGRLPTTYVNVDDAITRGIEVTLSVPLNNTLKLDSSYTFTKSEQKSGEYAGYPLNQMPRHMFNVSMDWTPTEKTNGWVKLSYRGEESMSTKGPSSGDFIAPSYKVVDLGGSYKFSKATTVYAGLYNLFDEEIRTPEYDFVEDGRRVWVGMNYKF